MHSAHTAHTFYLSASTYMIVGVYLCVCVCVIFHVIKFFNHEESIRRFAEREWRSVLVFSFTLSDLARFA